MKNKHIALLIFSACLCNAITATRAENSSTDLPAARQQGTESVENQPLFKKAVQADNERYNFAVSKGAKFLPTPDGKSFYILWLPPSASTQNTPPVVFTLHGHGSWAFDEFFLWQPHIAEAGIGIVALQWWFGEGETPKDYYLPREIEKIKSSILRSQKIAGRTVLAHGFSRGSANIYGLTALDNQNDKFILLTVANAGKAGTDFPVNRDISSGVFGPRPFEGTLWVTYAGAKDPHPDRDGIPGMREAQDWIRHYGGTVKLAIEDEKGDHGGFHRNQANVKKAIQVFKQLLTEQTAR